ncbi:MAG: RNB domain-containing ribonuclease, partial [Planctomycetaceae bacterium]|nr:RNB domain-containing ribonuclease [Planctomycetaceae bacterium]
IIEEFMLAANIAVATDLNDRGYHFLRRVHGDPSEQKMRTFAEFAETMGYPLKNIQSRKEIQKVLHKVKGQPEERSLNYALLRSLKQAEYSPVVMGHYALAEDQYCHFTSPIRRYPDLMVHRLLTSILTSNKAFRGQGMEELLRLGKHCSMTERRAERAERELIKIKLLSYMEDRVGEQMEAVVTGVDRFGFFARGVELPVEGLVHISTLPAKEHFDFDRRAMALISRSSGMMFRLGDHVTVEVAHVDVDRRELNFKLVAPPNRKQATKKKSKSRGSSKRAGGKNKRTDNNPSRRGRGRKK